MKKPSTTVILSSIAVLGVAATGVLAAIRAPKYLDILEKSNGNKAAAFAKTYGPAIVTGLATAGCIVASERVGAKALAASAATIGYLTQHRDALVDAIDEHCLPGQAEEIKSAAKNQIVCTAGPSVEETGRGDLLVIESYFGRWFRSSELNVREGIKKFNERFCNGEYVCFNDLYELLGIVPTHIGNQYGYAADPDYYDGPIDFECTLIPAGQYINENGLPVNEDVLIVDIYTYPMECWMDV